MNRVAVSVEADGERGEDCRAVALGLAVERFVDVLEAGLQRDPMTGEERQLRGAAREALERGEAVLGGELADRVHPGMKIERREARTGLADFGDALTNLGPDGRDRVGRHGLPPVEGKVSQIG
jgi:hypothetical protein